jgi:hypothetical protein
MAAKRAPRLTMEREAEISRLLSQCVPHAQVAAYLANKWHVGEPTIRTYIREVYHRWGALPSLDPAGRKEQMRQALMDFYVKASKAGAYSAAVTALDRLCKLDGLYAPDVAVVRGELSGQSQSISDTDPEKVRARMAELVRRYYPNGLGAGPALEATGAGGEGAGMARVSDDGTGRN